MKQYISPSSIAFELQMTSLMLNTSEGYTIDDPTLIQTQKKEGGFPWEEDLIDEQGYE